MQKFILIDVSEICNKQAENEIKSPVDLLQDEIKEGYIIENFTYINDYKKVLFLLKI